MKTELSRQALFPHWMRGVLLLAGGYNVLWGIFIVWFPESFFSWVTQSEALVPDIIKWQGRGVLFMAVVYLVTAIHPGRYWYLIFAAAFTKLAGGIWFYYAILETEVGKEGIFHLLMNDAIWIPLFIYIGFRARKYGQIARNNE